jgi:hypothetical protein
MNAPTPSNITPDNYRIVFTNLPPKGSLETLDISLMDLSEYPIREDEIWDLYACKVRLWAPIEDHDILKKYDKQYRYPNERPVVFTLLTNHEGNYFTNYEA